MSITIRQATQDDATAIYDMIYELAVYEKAPEEVVTTPEEIRETLFASGSKTEALICEVAGKAVGYAVFFTSYSTWLGRNGIYMEDLYVTPDYRGIGAGKALLKTIAQYAVQRQCGRLEWSVLDWNQPAIDFYLSIGAQPQDEWVRYRLTGDALRAFAEYSGSPAGRRKASTCWPRIRLRPRYSAAADRPAPDARPLRYRCTA